MVDLTTRLGSIQLKNPLIPASGCFGYGQEFEPFFELDILGALVLKGIYMNPRPGNSPPRLHETTAGLLNSIGLAGPGAPALKKIIHELNRRWSVPLIVNVCGGDDDEYIQVARFFDPMEAVSILELNISCPNIHSGGRCPAQDAGHTRRLVEAVKSVTQTPLMVKLSPNVPDIVTIALAAEEAGADSLSLVNTFLGMAVDLESRRPVFDNILAGYSGPAIKPMALKLVWETCSAVNIPVVGIGGIVSGRDALDFILAGAHAVQTGTVNLVEPTASVRILGEMEQIMVSLGIKRLDEIRGKLQI